jgi:hypothetical protein
MTASSGQKSTLVCQLAGKKEMVGTEKVCIVHTPQSCLSKATESNFGLIIVLFSIRPVSAQESIIELCTYLKNNLWTKETPLFGLMDMPQRNMTLKLQNAGVDFIKIFSDETPIDPGYLNNIVREKDVRFYTGRFLDRLCPFLNYNPIDDQTELITCAAYKNWMVLGGKRLREICENDHHFHCEYYIDYLNPRMKK